jgi:serine/threonine protein phosphatase 1
MIASLRQLFRSKPAMPLPEIPFGHRVYAIGDIHGRLDLLTALIDAVEADDAARPPAQTMMILLGDLIDRGPDSAGVLDLARQWQARRPVRILMGNHEEMMLQSFGSIDRLKHFLRHGGRETVLSYGVDETRYADAPFEEVHDMMLEAIPVADIEFMRSFEDQIWLGDYLFVHAGVRPGVWIESQKRTDLRWIREPFLSSEEHHGAMVVHGHTINDAAEQRDNRIGIDTGAYMSGVLTALALEGSGRRLIEARERDGTIKTQAVAA